jgi:hypothetical protein
MLDAIVLSRSPTMTTLLSATKSRSQITKTHLIRSPNTQYPRTTSRSLPISRTFPISPARINLYDMRTRQQLDVPRSSMACSPSAGAQHVSGHRFGSQRRSLSLFFRMSESPDGFIDRRGVGVLMSIFLLILI